MNSEKTIFKFTDISNYEQTRFIIIFLSKLLTLRFLCQIFQTHLDAMCLWAGVTYGALNGYLTIAKSSSR